MLHFAAFYQQPCRTFLLFLVATAGILVSACDQEESIERTTHRTTNGEIALNNLNAQIEHWRSTNKVDDSAAISSARREGLIYALTTRAPLRLRTEDFGDALTLAQDWAQRQPDAPESWLALAHAQAALHGFAAARKSLQQARNAGAPAARVDAALCSIERATGHYDKALQCAQKRVQQRENTQSLGHLAGVLGDRGSYAQAAEMFDKAWKSYPDPSPFVPAWLALSEAKMWMAAGKPELAASLLAQTLKRLPQHIGMQVEYAVALHELGQHEAAISVLRPLLDETSDPDVPNLMAIWLEAEEEAGPLAQRAAKGYAQRMQNYPAAYAAHAVEYWLGPGNDPAKALELARFNLEAGASVNALALLANTADAAGDAQAACDAAKRFLAVGEQTQAARRKHATAAQMQTLAQACG